MIGGFVLARLGLTALVPWPGISCSAAREWGGFVNDGEKRGTPHYRHQDRAEKAKENLAVFPVA
ncbi:MAG: hypothetical protein ABSG68_16440 [Thermoguttaceae bacterium]|jgi:hypothetical protein